MFITRASQKIYFNKFLNKIIYYNIEKYLKNLMLIISQIFFLLYK